MAQIPVELTHSLRFLNEFDKMTSDIISMVKTTDLKLKGVSKTDDKYGNKMRDIAKNAREDIDDEIEKIKTDYQLFNTEMTDLISKRNTEAVIYSLHSFETLYDKLTDKTEELDLLTKKLELEKDVNAIDKDFIRAIAYNKLNVPIFRAYTLTEHIIGRLKTLLGKT